VDVVLEILKWTALVFIAGLVGQVGKSLTLWLMGRAKEGRSRGAPDSESPPPQPSQKALKAAAKIEKKAAKDAAKEAKKS
jgi:hypothetical protein